MLVRRPWQQLLVARALAGLPAHRHHSVSYSGARRGSEGKHREILQDSRENFLTRQLDLSSLDGLNRAFTSWLEDEYHQREHSSLGMKPIDRFGLDLGRIRFLSPGDVNDELFLEGELSELSVEAAGGEAMVSARRRLAFAIRRCSSRPWPVGPTRRTWRGRLRAAKKSGGSGLAQSTLC
jgi:hypothetical protein